MDVEAIFIIFNNCKKSSNFEADLKSKNNFEIAYFDVLILNPCEARLKNKRSSAKSSRSKKNSPKDFLLKKKLKICDYEEALVSLLKTCGKLLPIINKSPDL